MTTDTASPPLQNASAPAPRWHALPAVPESVGEARRFAASLLGEADADHVDDVVLVVSELITNAVREVAESDGNVRLGVDVRPWWTHLYAADTASTLPKAKHPDPLAGSGRGIPIINSLAAMTWIDQDDDGKTIHVVLTRTGGDLTPHDRELLNPRPPGEGALLRPREVAAVFGVRPSTIARWAREGKLAPLLTPGGHRRYRLADIREVLGSAGSPEDRRMAEDAARL